jgi:phage FluMu gp28-like protein
MIFYIEHDQAGNIVHVARDVQATIVPLINRITFCDANGNPLKSEAGAAVSSYGSEMVDPVEIDEATYNMLMDQDAKNFIFDQTSQAVTKKAVQDGN